MKDKEEFFNTLTEIDGAEYSEYNRLVGDFEFSRFVLRINQIPPEPVEPALFVVRVHQSVAGFPVHLFNTPVRRTALEDLLTRKVNEQLERLARYDEEGLSRRRISAACPGQKILPRSSLVVGEDYVEARLHVDLPMRAGRIAGQSAKDTFFEDLPEVVNGALLYCNLPEGEVEEFVELMEDADQVRQVLPTRGWVSFVGEGSMLRRLGHTDLPDYEGIETLSIAEELIEEVEVPNLEKVRGMGIPAGITLILGDEHSGRSELMRAIAAGTYNHIPGDGRELVVTMPDAVHIAAESGRSVQRVNLSAFARRTDNGAPPACYSADRADPIMAQAAAVVEALEVGAHALLFDEEDSAPAFLVRDARLEPLLGGEEEDIVPLASRARQLADELGISLVIGGAALCAEFIPVADTVFRVRDHQVEDVTAEAKALGIRGLAAAAPAAGLSGLVEHSRWVVPSSINPSMGRADQRIAAPDIHTLAFGRSIIDLSAVSQIADVHQTLTIGLIIAYARTRYMEVGRPVREVLDLIDRDLSSDGLECLTRDLRGDLTRPRRFEIAAALNRLPTLRITEPAE